jgi:hypothetical protein
MSLRQSPVERSIFWLSFANEECFGGVVVVDLAESEIGEDIPVLAAVKKTIERGMNPGPGYSVQCQRLPADEIPPRYKNRLLTTADVNELIACRSLH